MAGQEPISAPRDALCAAVKTLFAAVALCVVRPLSIRHRIFPGNDGVRCGSRRAQAGHDAAFVRSPLQALERLCRDHSCGDQPAVAQVGRLCGPRARECTRQRRTVRSTVRGISERALRRAPLDLIIAFGGPAATFVQQHRQQLFPRYRWSLRPLTTAGSNTKN
jgi:hypothetical protein